MSALLLDIKNHSQSLPRALRCSGQSCSSNESLRKATAFQDLGNNIVFNAHFIFSEAVELGRSDI
jgi:hypothetical protein